MRLRATLKKWLRTHVRNVHLPRAKYGNRIKPITSELLERLATALIIYLRAFPIVQT